ncbi:MAG: hypothetical protein QM582_00830 [Micropruina sp.]|uniref:hypothetical protein n=1 Tax=Micropruina sp. TaxID=2737536 RepID=UPI0039E4D667
MSGPRPLILVHQLVGAFSTSCGRFAGQRRFDAQLRTFVQDSAHLSLPSPEFDLPGRVISCRACLDIVAGHAFSDS